MIIIVHNCSNKIVFMSKLRPYYNEKKNCGTQLTNKTPGSATGTYIN